MVKMLSLPESIVLLLLFIRLASMALVGLGDLLLSFPSALVACMVDKQTSPNARTPFRSYYMERIERRKKKKERVKKKTSIGLLGEETRMRKGSLDRIVSTARRSQRHRKIIKLSNNVKKA